MTSISERKRKRKKSEPNPRKSYCFKGGNQEDAHGAVWRKQQDVKALIGREERLRRINIEQSQFESERVRRGSRQRKKGRDTKKNEDNGERSGMNVGAQLQQETHAYRACMTEHKMNVHMQEVQWQQRI